DDKSQVFNFRHFEFTSLQFKVKFVLPEDLKYTLGDLTMFFERTGEDEDVIKIDEDLPFQNKIVEDVVHEVLEGSGGISETKEHNKRLK
ncbi:hypothetical protein PAXINDRAFT_78198, partial [Paxillus involutus ATCC 200175]